LLEKVAKRSDTTRRELKLCAEKKKKKKERKKEEKRGKRVHAYFQVIGIPRSSRLTTYAELIHE
jgi:hypothetical protein